MECLIIIDKWATGRNEEINKEWIRRKKVGIEECIRDCKLEKVNKSNENHLIK